MFRITKYFIGGLLVASLFISKEVYAPIIEKSSIVPTVNFKTTTEYKPILLKQTISTATVNTLDLRTSSVLCAKQLEKGLRKNLKGKAKLIVQYAKKYNICSIFIASVAALESGWGTSNWATKKNNFFGFAFGKKYTCFEQSLQDFSNWIAKEYLTENGKWFQGYTLNDINTHYAQNPNWDILVGEIMIQIYNDTKGE